MPDLAQKVTNIKLPSRQKRTGDWSIKDISGSVRGVSEAIDNLQDIPDHWKTAIKEDIKLRCGDEFNFVYVDAHCHVEKGHIAISYHATPDKKLL